MSENYPPLDEFTDPVVILKNDPETDDNLNKAPKANANRTEFLRNRLLPEGTVAYHILMRTPERSSGGFQRSTGTDLAWEDTQTSGSTIEWFANRPVTGRIVSVTVISKGKNHTTTPAVAPRIDLYRYDPLTGAAVTVAFDSDPAGTASIDSMHPWGITALTTESISDDRFYAVKITGESGTGSQAGHTYHSIYLGVAAAT